MFVQRSLYQKILYLGVLVMFSVITVVIPPVYAQHFDIGRDIIDMNREQQEVPFIFGQGIQHDSGLPNGNIINSNPDFQYSVPSVGLKGGDSIFQKNEDSPITLEEWLKWKREDDIQKTVDDWLKRLEEQKQAKQRHTSFEWQYYQAYGAFPGVDRVLSPELYKIRKRLLSQTPNPKRLYEKNQWPMPSVSPSLPSSSSTNRMPIITFPLPTQGAIKKPATGLTDTQIGNRPAAKQASRCPARCFEYVEKMKACKAGRRISGCASFSTSCDLLCNY